MFSCLALTVVMEEKQTLKCRQSLLSDSFHKKEKCNHAKPTIWFGMALANPVMSGLIPYR